MTDAPPRGRPWVGVLSGVAIWIVIGAAGLGGLRAMWPNYARAEPDKSYTFAMLIARLSISVIASIVAGTAAAQIARGSSAAWWLGVVLLAGSAPIHLAIVWADYPAWYHLAYLVSLIPLTGSSGAMVTARNARSRLVPR